MPYHAERRVAVLIARTAAVGDIIDGMDRYSIVRQRVSLERCHLVPFLSVTKKATGLKLCSPFRPSPLNERIRCQYVFSWTSNILHF
jgi:hypothetical protein